MARFNGLTAQQGGHPNNAARSDADGDGAVWTPEQVARWRQEQALLQQQSHPLARPPVARGSQSGPGPAGYPQSYHPAHEPALSQHPHSAHAPPDPYGAGAEAWRQQPGWSAAPQGFDPQPPAHTPYSDPSTPMARGYDQPQFGDFSGRQPVPGRHDSQGWDLASYPPGQQAGYGTTGGHPEAHHWPGQHGTGAAHGQQYYGDPGFDPNGRGTAPGYPPKFQFDPSETNPNGQHHDFAESPEDEEPRRRTTSAFVVAGALIGAIVLGGGLAYAYKQFTATASSDKTPPVVKADKSSPKAKPATPGGKDVAHTDKKFLNQLTDTPANASPTDATPAEQDGGPRKVTTLVVGRDGSVATPPPVLAAPSPPPPVSGGGVPGMVIDGGPRPMLRGPAPSTENPSPPSQTTSGGEQRLVPRVSEMALPKVRAEPPRAPTPAPEPTQQVAKAAPAKKTAPARDDAAFSPVAAPAAVATPAAAPRTSSAGFVAVLASRKSREEAFSMYPDLQVKFSDILSDKTPDVRETNLTAQGKGIVYRLILGPPGSKESAIDTCNKLKAQGFTGCWATPY